MLDIIILILLVFLLLISNRRIIKKHEIPIYLGQHLDYLLFYHILFSLLFTFYILTYGGDSIGFWRFNLQQVRIAGEVSWFSYYGISTYFPLFLNYIPSQILGLNYVTGNILYGFLGFVGLRFLFLMVLKNFKGNAKILNLFPLLFYLPNIHFWSAGVGKDTLCFFGIAWFLFAIQNYNSRWWQLILAFLFVYHARPHMGFMLLGGGTIAILLDSNVKPVFRVFLIISSAVAFFILSQNVLEFLRIADFSIESLEALSYSKVELLNRESVGSAIDISGYSLPLKIFTYLYRPLFFDAHNFVSFFSSIENLFYLILSFQLFSKFSLKAFKDAPLFLKTGIITFIPVTIAFATSLSNLGITMRMKNMTMIYFLLFCFYLIVHHKNQRSMEARERLLYQKKRQETGKVKKRSREAYSPKKE